MMFPRMYETGPGEAWTTQEFTRYQAVGLDKSVEFGYADSTKSTRAASVAKAAQAYVQVLPARLRLAAHHGVEFGEFFSSERLRLYSVHAQV